MSASDETPTPAAQRVERTGLALVHEGERIYAAEGLAAPLGPLSPAVVPETVVLVVCRNVAEAVLTLVALISTVVGMYTLNAVLVKTPRIAVSKADDTADSAAAAERTAFIDQGKLVFSRPDTCAR